MPIVVKNVSGSWDKKTKRNEKEALEIVELIKKLSKTSDYEKSIGIITFNINQQKLIEELLQKESIINKRIDE